MQTNSVADVLRALATGDKSRSETARLRDVFGEVEAALSAGVSRAAVLEALHGQGFTFTSKSFESALYRIRKERQEGGKKQVTPTPGAKPTTATAGETKKADDPLTKPAGFDYQGTRDEKDLF